MCSLTDSVMMSASLVPSLRGPLILQLLPDSPSSSSCSSRRVRQLSLSALAYSFLPGPPGPEDSSKPGRPTSRRSGFSKRRSPLRTGGQVSGLHVRLQNTGGKKFQSIFHLYTIDKNSHKTAKRNTTCFLMITTSL